jgi:hypothetical protein
VITEFFIWVMAGLFRLVLGLFPTGNAGQSAQVADGVQSGIGTVFGYAASFGNWVPWSAIGPALLVVIGVLGAAAVVKLVRIVASFLSFGGGSAA